MASRLSCVQRLADCQRSHSASFGTVTRISPWRYCRWHSSGAAPRMFGKLLVANRGEIACRVIRTAKRLGVKTVAVYSEPDAASLHVRMADEAHCIGPAASAKSYLNMEKILDVAKQTSAEAIHPGYGFLSENATFARRCKEEDVVFVGPPPQAITDMGLKDKSKKIMAEAGVPIIEGYHGEGQEVALLRKEAQHIGYPVMLKAVMGGGGKGMRIARSDDEFEWQLQQAKDEAKSSFNDDRMIIEKFVELPRHVEVQVFADQLGNTVYLFERDCSVQRRHQKIIEESPAPGLSDDVRHEIGQAAVRAAKAVGYVGAGTVEFLMDRDKKFYFMEMNTRLQVEHPVTEMVTRTDLVEWQLRVAAGERLEHLQEDLRLHGHAFEARIYAERTEKTPDGPMFLPSSGRLDYLSPPGVAEDVRVETGVVQGDEVLSFYDPMIAKLVVWAPNRTSALEKLRQCLHRYHIVGPSTNIAFLDRLAAHSEFIAGNVHTDFIPQHWPTLMGSIKPMQKNTASQAALFLLLWQDVQAAQASTASSDPFSPFRANSASRLNITSARKVTFIDQDKSVVRVRATPADGGFDLEITRVARPKAKKGKGKKMASLPVEPESVETVHVDGQLVFEEGSEHGWQLHYTIGSTQGAVTVVRHGDQIHIFTPDGSCAVEIHTPNFKTSRDALLEVGNILCPPMTSTVKKVMCKAGDRVAKDEVLVVVEAMKMKFELRAPRDGVIKEVNAVVDGYADEKTALVVFEDAPEELEE